jgi:hypothetical protein
LRKWKIGVREREREKGREKRYEYRACSIASLTASRTPQDDTRGGSPVAFELSTPYGFGAFFNMVIR